MIVLLFIFIFIICIIILYKQHTVENLGSYLQSIDYNMIDNGGVNKTCEMEDVRCSLINPKYTKKTNFKSILCLNNCVTDTLKLNTCCNKKPFCDDNSNLCGDDTLIKNADETECSNNVCTKKECCNIESSLNTKYSKINNAIVINDKNIDIFLNQQKNKYTYENKDNYCKEACSSHEIPNCLGFSLDKSTNTCTLFNIVGDNTYIAKDNMQNQDVYIKKNKIHLFKAVNALKKV